VTSTAVLINPARVSNLVSVRRLILRALAEEGWPEPLWLETSPDETGERQARLAVSRGAAVLFVCGGDGTVLAAVAALSGSETALAVIPSGTGNVLALNLELPSDVASAVRLATRGDRRRIDLGVVEGRPFTVAAGMGLDAQVLADTPHRVKRRLGWPAYVSSGLRRIGDPRFRVSLRVDGGEPVVREVRSVLVANVGRFPGGFNLLPEAVPDDGLLDVALIAPHRLRDWVKLLVSVRGRHPRGGRMETMRGKVVEVATDEPWPREMDGDPLSSGTSLAVSVLPLALTVCVPRATSRPGLRK